MRVLPGHRTKIPREKRVLRGSMVILGCARVRYRVECGWSADGVRIGGWRRFGPWGRGCLLREHPFGVFLNFVECIRLQHGFMFCMAMPAGTVGSALDLQLGFQSDFGTANFQTL